LQGFQFGPQKRGDRGRFHQRRVYTNDVDGSPEQVNPAADAAIDVTPEKKKKNRFQTLAVTRKTRSLFSATSKNFMKRPWLRKKLQLQHGKKRRKLGQKQIPVMPAGLTVSGPALSRK